MELITNEMYSKLPNLILGFHGCGKDTYEKVLYEHQHLKKSENEYDVIRHFICPTFPKNPAN